MAPMKRGRTPMKRAMKSGGRPAKKAKKEDDVLAKCKSIGIALKHAEKKGVQSSLIELLSEAVTRCLPVYKADRHEFQHSIVGMVAKILATSKEALEADVTAAQELLNNGDAERTRREEALKSAETALTESKETHQKKQEAKTEKQEALKASVEALKAAQAAQKTGDEKAQGYDAEKTALESAVSTSLAPLKEGSGSKKSIHALAKWAASAGLESSIIEAMELPLSKKPDARGSFDAVILEQLDLQISQKLATLNGHLAEEAPAREQRAAVVKAAQEAHDAAKAASEASVAELKAAKEAEAAAKTALAAASEAVQGFSAELLSTAGKLDRSKTKLEGFVNGPLADFNSLVEYAAPVPEPEEVEPVAEATAEAAAPAAPA
eukprot:TRINITY_DN473_c0_g1_i2.p1 TRINITY_DN473_c0_g1~~TRINITY_DN473_c0_g1_i2.p1  ORF type:complete len:404 (+),score=151.85 TRINITY_DN473_c0_g1_i2:78-1214(+)